MNRKYISNATIEIEAPASRIWNALVTPEIAKEYLFGANIESDWKENSPITFNGEYNGNKYEEKGILMNVKPNIQLQYTHWSSLEGIPDIPENYRIWTFDLSESENQTRLSISEDNISNEKKQKRSNEIWSGVLSTNKKIVEK
jgi:uncharacterized protein YndB with AHSA1/START domain